VAATTYGCAFTNNTIGIDDTTASTATLRNLIVNSPGGACPP